MFISRAVQQQLYQPKMWKPEKAAKDIAHRPLREPRHIYFLSLYLLNVTASAALFSLFCSFPRCESLPSIIYVSLSQGDSLVCARHTHFVRLWDSL